MPALCRPVPEGGVGFDYRLGMGAPAWRCLPLGARVPEGVCNPDPAVPWPKGGRGGLDTPRPGK